MREHAPLFWGSAFTAALLVISLGLMAFDSRLVTGANPWLKPVKFELSIVAFNLTVAWMLSRLAASGREARVIEWVVAVAMFIEISAIVVQAARGMPSHYNISTPLNAAIFGSMGFAIFVNTLALVWLCVLYFSPQPQLPPAITWGVRLGIVLFLLSSLQGFQMISNRGHTVGAADGGPGLPLVRWSTVAGDLRIAHFLGLHALQALPLLGFIVSTENRQAGVPVVAAAFVAILALFIWTLLQAWAGRPLRIFSA